MTADIDSNLANWSTTASSNQPDASDSISNLDDNLPEIQAVVRKYLATKGANTLWGSGNFCSKELFQQDRGLSGYPSNGRCGTNETYQEIRQKDIDFPRPGDDLPKKVGGRRGDLLYSQKLDASDPLFSWRLTP